MSKKEFKYYPEDFPPLVAKPTHMNLTFDIYDDYTDVQNHTSMQITEKTKELSLDARNLEIKDVRCAESKIEYEYKKEQDKLIIKFKKSLKSGEIINLFTHVICRPSKNTLEGLYYDETPKGAPPTMITQCQQWGFSRITPCFDDMQAKCTYMTKIIADSRYTHIISNGDVFKPRVDLPTGRSEIMYINTRTPMAPYLFFLGVGTYEQHERIFEYPDADQFTLQLLTLPGADKHAANEALEILHDGIMWIHLFTGEKAYENMEQRKKVFELIKKRERMRQEQKESPVQIRQEIAKAVAGLTVGYKYTGQVYREIAMQNSNFGGMENVGNTTVVANRIMPAPKMPDSVFEYLIAVKAHEFYHNLNGSEVTGASPFELWLNEAVTCLIEHKYTEFLSDSQYSRLGEVMSIISPDGGTLDYDTGSMTMPIIPKGFNSPDDLITEVTYSKAPQFVRMVESVMGKDKFAKALAHYHSKFSHANATTQDWIDCMSEVSGIDLNQMALSWLHQTGYPTVHIKKEYKDKKFTLHLKQSGFTKGHWQFPFSAALLDNKGVQYAHEQIFMQDVEQKLVFEDVENPAAISFCRGYLFYGKIDYDFSDSELYTILKHDTDYINRYIAFTKIAQKEKMNMLKDDKAQPSDKFISTFYELLSDKELCEKMGTALLAIPQSVEDKEQKHKYEKLYQISKKISHTIASKYKKELIQIYNEYKEKTIAAPYVQKKLYEIKMRSVKNTALSLLSELDTEDIHNLILEQFENPTAASDKYAAFAFILDSSIKTKQKIIEQYEKQAAKDLVEWEVFLARIGGNDAKNPIEIIKSIENSKNFRIEQSNDQRMFMRFAFNKRISMLTKEGRQYLKEITIKLAKLNEYSTMHILSIFSKINDFEKEHHEPLVSLLKQIYDALDEKKQPSTCNTIRRLLKGAPEAVKNYEVKNGKLEAKYL